MSKSNKYRVIRQKLWSQPEFQDYSLEKKLLWIYLQTGSNCNQLGIYPFLPRYVHLETGLSIEQINAIMDEFARDGLIIYNEKTHEVCVLNFMSDQVAKGGTAVTQCLESDYKKVQDTSLIDAMLEYNLPLMDELPKTARDFLVSISHSNDIEENNEDTSTDNKEVTSENKELNSNNETVRINTGDNTESVRESVRDNTTVTKTVNDDITIIPTVDMVTKYIADNYYLDTATATATADAFIMYNEKDNWSFAKRSPWTKMLIGFLAKDKYHRFDDEAVELRKAEVEKKAEEERIEQEQKDEAERKQQEYKSMFRECWGDYLSINSAQDLLDYIKTNHFSEYDYSLGKCLYDQLYISHTLEEITVMALFDKGIIAYDEVSDYIRINDCDIEQAKEPIKKIAEKLKKDSWSEKYRVPEPPKVFVPYQRSVPWQ